MPGPSPAPRTPKTQRHLRWVLVRVGQCDFGFREDIVCHLEPHCHCLPVKTEGPPWIRGWMLVQDNAIPAIDLAQRFGFAPTPDPSPAVVVDIGDHVMIALLVARLSDVVVVRPADITQPRAVRPYTPFISGVWRGRSRACYLVDAGSLVSTEVLNHLLLPLRQSL